METARNGLLLTGVSKRFGATRALADAELHIRPGEVHTLLGENGSGKSTIVKIIGGVHRPDTGALMLNGKPVDLRSPRSATENGVAVVFQEVLTAGHQSVLDNIWLGSDGTFARRRRRSEQRAIAQEVLNRLLDDVSIDQSAEELSLSERQAVCIVRALVRQPSVLVLDESTAALDIQTRERLFAEVRRLTAAGASVLFISHRMDEVEEISDQVTVLRSGRTISTVSRAEMSIPQLIADMTGGGSAGAHTKLARAKGKVTLHASGVRLGSHAKPIDFELHAGELVGIAGLEGHGQDLFIRRLAGLWQGEGVCARPGENDTAQLVRHRHGRRLGVAYLPRERRGESLFETLSIRENFALPTLSKDLAGGLLVSPRKMVDRFEEFVSQLSIRFGRPNDPISSLSGGNQQKVLLARWLATKPDVLLLNDPTRGVDIGTKREIYGNLERLCAQGMSVVVLSSEVGELLELVDRVLVFRDQEVFAEIPREHLSGEAIVAAYFGQEAGVAA